MDNFTKWLWSVIMGALAAFFGQYGLFIVLVAVAVVLDVVTGLIKAKATGEGLSSEKATNRKNRLTKAGYDYQTVQAEVNRLLR